MELLVPPQIRDQAAEWTTGTDAQIRVLRMGLVPRLLECLALFLRRRPAVVHVNHAVSPVLMAARLAGVQARFVTDHVLPLRPSYNKRGEALRMLTMSSATDVVVFSRQNMLLAAKSWRTLPVHTIAAGVPEASCPCHPFAIRKELGISSAATIVGLVGRLTAQKRQQVFLRAIAGLRDNGVNVHGLLVGEGEDREDIESSISALRLADCITLTGNRGDVGCLLQAMDIYAQPSAWEGICFALLEAMSAGLPCVVTDIPVFREVVGGIDAPLVPVDDEPALTAAISEFVMDGARANNSGTSGRKRWAELYTVERMAFAHNAAYRSEVAEW